VLEPLSGYLALAKELLEGQSAFAEGWNFGPARADMLTVGEVVELFANNWGSDASSKLDESNCLHEAAVLIVPKLPKIFDGRLELQWIRLLLGLLNGIRHGMPVHPVYAP